MTLLPSLALGFVLGVRHATDADHIAAIGTIVSNGRSARKAAAIGAAWGVGHSASVLLVGGTLILLRLPMPARVALALEFAVALMLIGLGIRSLAARGQRSAGGSRSTLRPLVIGIMHGLAGSAVLALLVLGTAANTVVAAVYLVCFCLGTIGGMALITALLSLPAYLLPARALPLERGVRVAAGVASVAIGLAMAHRIGTHDGLFGATPSLVPTR